MALTDDHGFAPGGGTDPATPGPTGQQARIRELLQRRPSTTLHEIPQTVHDFVEVIRTDPDEIPIGNALIGSHANSEGHIFIEMFVDQATVVQSSVPGQTDFEVLQATLDPAHTEQSIKMTAIFGASGNHFVHFIGCNIGKVTKFMNKFKEALAANHLTAPNHFHGLTFSKDAGVFEYMAYEFKVFRKEHFPNRGALIDAFKAGGFEMLNDQPNPRLKPVPPGRWDEWVPKKNFKKTLPKPLSFKLGQTVGGHKTLTVDREYRVSVMDKKDAFKMELPGLSPFPPKTAYEGRVFDAVRSLPDFQETHPFPFYERWGYDDVEEFLAGLKWTFRRGTKDEVNTLIGTGTRIEYSILVPIVDPADGHLFFNFYPNTGTMPPKQILETDPFFFSTV